MKRRQLIQFAGAGFLAALGNGLVSTWQAAQAQSGPLSIQWLGHTSFLFTGGGQRILVNPFRPIGCTAGYRAPQVQADLVMISSRLFDEGYVDGLLGDPRLLSEPGIFQLQNIQIQGVPVPHDREGGRRFGTNVIWRWTQGGLNIVHLGGAAGPIEFEQQVLLGRPDVLFIPVGGGPKAYTPQEARQAIQTLNPKLIVPMHYRTQAADANACDIEPLDNFLSIMDGVEVRRINGDALTLSAADVPSSGSRIVVFSYPF